jgi:hypothetical protein
MDGDYISELYAPIKTSIKSKAIKSRLAALDEIRDIVIRLRLKSQVIII